MKQPATDAYEVHDKFWADSGGNLSIPIDPYALAKSMGINVYLAVLGPDRSGYLSINDEVASIYVNEAFSHARNRFTVAHEIGHYVDMKNSGQLSRGGTFDRAVTSALGTDPLEIYANRFAAALLMPKESVTKLHHEGLNTDELAHRFRVSRAAMENRLKNLRLPVR